MTSMPPFDILPFPDHVGKCRSAKNRLNKYFYNVQHTDCPLFAIKPPFHPRSSRCSFSECLYTRHFPKQALLDLP